MAVTAGVERAVQIHIDRGDDLNARDEKGQTALMLSAARNKATICKLLLAAGADADLLDHSGRNALGIARAAGATQAVAAIEAACTPLPIAHGGDGLDASSGASISSPSITVASDQPVLSPAVPSTAETNELPAPPPESAAAMPEIAWAAGEEDSEFDLTGWETEEGQPPPEDDPTLTAAALEVQSAITEHQCRRRSNIDHLCRFNFDQGLMPAV